MNPKDRMEGGSGGLLAGLYTDHKGRQFDQTGLHRSRRPQAQGSDNYIRTKKEDAMLRAGKVPAGWNKGEDGKVRPMVQ